MLFDLQCVSCGSRIILLKEAPTHFSGGSLVKNLLANAGDVRSLGWEDPLEQEMATHSSILAWKIPWTKESGRLQSVGSQRVGHNLATKQQ